jgi:hypothetical protein
MTPNARDASRRSSPLTRPPARDRLRGAGG